MAAPILKSRRFRQEREADWTALDRLLRRVEREGAAKLDDQQLLSIPVLYRATLSSLSVARATSLDHDLIEYLESLCARAYFFVYGSRTTLLQRAGQFFAVDWPLAAQALWRETAASAILMLLGTAAAYLLVIRDPDWFYAVIPEAMAGGRSPSASTAFLHAVLYDSGKHQPLSFFATFLFTHNAQIALSAFALGFAFCVPSALLMIYNGCTLGAMFALYAPRGLGFQLGGWLFIHGTTELFAVTLAGAAGLRIGWTLAFPGRRTRLDALGDAGRQGAALMFGVVVMLFIAGLLEGLGRQLIRSDAARYAIALGMAVFWSTYLYWPRRARAPR